MTSHKTIHLPPSSFSLTSSTSSARQSFQPTYFITVTPPSHTPPSTVTMSTSAIYEEPTDVNANGNGHHEPLKVLITTHDDMNLMDLAGPLEVFSNAHHDKSNPGRCGRA